MPSRNERTDGLHRTGFRLGVAALTLGALVLGGGSALGHAADGHPAKLHEGSCEELGRVAFSLEGVGAWVDADDQAIATPEAVNPASAYQVMVSHSTVPDLTLDALIGAPHALMVYESDEDLTGIGCGNIGGALLDGELATGIAEIGVAGHSGIALFQEGDGGVEVSIYLGHALAPVSSQMGAGGAEHEDDGHTHDGEENGHTHEDEATGDATPAAN